MEKITPFQEHMDILKNDIKWNLTCTKLRSPNIDMQYAGSEQAPMYSKQRGDDIPGPKHPEQNDYVHAVTSLKMNIICDSKYMTRNVIKCFPK